MATFKKILTMAMAMLFCGAAARADYLRGITPVCDWRSLSHPGCEEPFCQAGRQNYNRDFPMGNGAPPLLSELKVLRQYPFPGEFLTIQLSAQADAAAGDSVSAQYLLWGEIAYSTTGGSSWHMNGEAVTPTSGMGLAMDWFTREVLASTTGSSAYKSFTSETKPWEVSRVNAKWMSGDPAPNRRGTATGDPATTGFAQLPVLPAFPGSMADGYENMIKYKTFTSGFAEEKCPWSLNCPIYDAYPTNNGDPTEPQNEWPDDFTNPLGANGLGCSRGNNPLGVPGVDNCNVPGFPEGGGDILDAFPDCANELDGDLPADFELPCDPYDTDWPNIPGEPLVRVNGIPGISCDVYTDANPNWNTETHPLCGTSAIEPLGINDEFFTGMGVTPADVYALYGILPYTLQPLQGVVKFNNKLETDDVVDAVFYTGRRRWTAKIDMNDSTLAGVNNAGSQFRFFPRVYDTCGNLASGAKANSSNSPTFNPTSNESTTYVMGGNDSDYDLVPTDLDPLTSWTEDVSFRNAGPSQCSATDTYCPDTKLPVTCDANPDACNCSGEGGRPTEPGCECCYNECSPTRCTFLGDYNNCTNTGDAGNPPGCGSEFGGKTGQLEINDFMVSHTSANLYLKLKTMGDMEWGCYGVYYLPFGIGCEFLGDTDQKSKINAYAFQVVNTDPDRTGTYFIMVVPEILGLYGPIIVFLDLPKLMGEFAKYDGTTSNCAYADGGGACGSMCDKGGESGDSCEELGCYADISACPANPSCPSGTSGPTCQCGPNGNCDGDGWINSADNCPCDAAEEGSDNGGCPPPEPPEEGFDKYMCKSCAIEGGAGADYMYLEMGYEGTINSAGSNPYSIYAATISIHDLSAEFMDDLLCILCQKGFVFEKLLSDMTPRVNYYARGPLSQSIVEVRNDTIAPVTPEIEACLGRCGAYDPSTTTIEVRWPEVVFNEDSFKSDLVDLGGYKVYVSRGQGSAYTHYYTICSPDESDDCALQSPTVPTLVGTATVYVTIPRTAADKTYDEPFQYTRFPRPFDQLKTDTAAAYPFNFPGEPVSIIIDSDCDIANNNIDDDKDGMTDEGCYSGAPDYDRSDEQNPVQWANPPSNSIRDSALHLAPDGQEYWFRAISYDSDPNYSGPPYFPNPMASGYHAQSPYSNIAKAPILRNTVPPEPPQIRQVYSMGYGRTTKVAWRANTEKDLGGYAVYRCPANPADAIRMAEGDLPADYCMDESHYRRVNKDILAVKATNYLDNGEGYYEGGDTDDDDGDGSASEWIDCSDAAEASDRAKWLNDLALCGNLNVNTAAPTWATGTEPGLPGDLYPAADTGRPVLFTTGLVDGYEYYYKLRAVDRPYSGDGTADPGSCNNGLNGYAYTNGVDASNGGSGCINPIDDSAGLPFLAGRTCDDPTIKNNWSRGGNCSDLTPTNMRKKVEPGPGGTEKNYYQVTADGLGGETETPILVGDPLYMTWSIVAPSDFLSPSKPVNVRAVTGPEGTSVTLTWNDHSSDPTFDHYNIFRTNVSEGFFACLRGTCEDLPYRNGCACTNHTDCVSYDAATFPTPCQPVDCKTPQTDPDKCKDQDGDGNKEINICASSAADPNKYIDNDGDGMIDEELPDEVDNDADGLVDEDAIPENAVMNAVGKCPWGASLKDTTKAEVIYSNYYTELYLTPGQTYYYKVSAVDNAMYDDPEDPNETPNESPRSNTAVVITRDTKAPDAPIGPCPYVAGLPTNVKPCAEILDPEDLAGHSVTVTWFSTSTLDIAGYDVYRSTDGSSYTKVNSSLIPVPTSTDTIRYQVAGLENSANYYFKVRAVDESNNASNYSATAGPVSPGDAVAPNPPLWNPLYRDHANCPNPPPANCTTEVNHSCDAGGATAYGKSGSLKVAWAPKSQTECLPNNSTEGDFSYFNLYRRQYTADTGPETCNSTTNTNCTINDTDCLLAGGLTQTEFIDDGCVQYKTQGACNIVSGCSWNDDCAKYTNSSTCEADTLCNWNATICETDNVLSKCKAAGTGSLDNGKTYYYCLTAVDDSGNESLVSGVESGEPVDNLPPDKPTGLTATPLAGTRVGLGWNMLDASQFTDLAGYVIYRGTSTLENSYQRIDISDTDPNRSTVDQGGDTVEIITGNAYSDNYNLVTGQTYYYKITAIDELGNESKKSDPASVIPVDADNTAPAKVTTLYSRPGFNDGEAVTTDGLDDDTDGFIDDARADELTVELHWNSIKDYDLASYNVYRSGPVAIENCAYSPADGDCDGDNIPNGNDQSCDNCCGACPLDDCDKDGLSNAIDSPNSPNGACACIPNSPETNQFGTYTKLNSSPVGKTTACPAAEHVRPTGTLSENTCYYTDVNTGETICNGSRYWYIVTGTDTTGNETALDKTTAHPATPVERDDSVAPENPLAWCSKNTTQSKCNSVSTCSWDAGTSKCLFADGTEDWKKPKVIEPPEGGKTVVVFYENDMTVSKNQDIQGYSVYRDTNFNGSYENTRTLFLNKMVPCTQEGLPDCHCDKANILDACYIDLGVCGGADWLDGKTYDCLLDVDVANDTKYFYMVDTFDEVPNFSEKSGANSGKPQIAADELLPSPIGFEANAISEDPNALLLTWSSYQLDTNPNFAGYMLYRANAESGAYNLIDPQPTTPAIELITNVSYLDAGLISGDTYYYWLYSVDVNNKKSATPAQCCRATGDCSQNYCYGIPGTDIRPPMPPTGLVAIPGNTSAALSWNSVVAPDLAGYNVCRGTVPAGIGDCSSFSETACNADSACRWINNTCDRKWTKANTSAITYPKFTDTGLTNGKIYWYYVTAYDTSYNPAADTACDPQNRDTNDSVESSKASATPSASGSGRSVTRGWNLLSVPASGGARSSAKISVADSDTAILKYDPETGRYITLDSSTSIGLDGGRAFWVYSPSGGEVKFDGDIIYTGEVTLALRAQWNLLGNPFANQFDWNDQHVEFSLDGAAFVPLSAADSNGWITGAWRFEDNAYPELNSGETLLPFTGFWVKTSQALTIRLKQ